MPGDVIGMGVRHKAARLTSTDVNRELSPRQEEAGIVVKHGVVVSCRWCRVFLVNWHTRLTTIHYPHLAESYTIASRLAAGLVA